MTADQARALLDVMTAAIENEANGTRRVLAAIPNAKRDYKPDPKSRSAWELATHVAMSDVWFADSILNGAFVWTGEPPVPPEMTDPAGVAKWHERELGTRLARLRAMTPDQLTREVEFFGMKAPAVTWLVMMNNHAVHHRGQLGTYLRPMGAKMPAIYGMSADENAFA
jgi:uncharacterized damage-inducible protein DinB